MNTQAIREPKRASIGTRINGDLKARFEAIAARRGLAPSTALRVLLVDAVERAERDEDSRVIIRL